MCHCYMDSFKNKRICKTGMQHYFFFITLFGLIFIIDTWYASMSACITIQLIYEGLDWVQMYIHWLAILGYILY